MEISNQVLPTEILEVLQEVEFENVGGINIERLEYLDNNSLLNLRIDTGSELPTQFWQITVENIVSEKLERRWVYDNRFANIEIHTDHYLLWEFTKQHTSLYTKGNAISLPDQAGVVFYTKHMEQYGQWLPVETYLNSMGLFNAIKMPHGLFSQGPKKILSRYKKWLDELGVSTYFLELQGSVDDDAVGSNPDLKLLILGNSWFIGSQFLFRRLAD